VSGEASSTQKIEGSVERVVFHNEENGYSVLRVILDGRTDAVTVTGKVPMIVAGERLEGSGAWTEVRNYGSQFAATELKALPPGSPEGIERYLGSGLIKGVGEVYARKIVRVFGAETLEIIDKHSAMLERIDGIGPKRRKEIKASWKAQKGVHGVMVFLHDHGVGTAQAARIQKTYGDEALEVLRTDPYRMVKDLEGVGFKTADRIATKVGLDQASTARVRAGVLHLLEEGAGEGHCAVPKAELVAKAQELLGVDEESCLRAVSDLHGEGDVFPEDLHEVPHVFLDRLHRAEIRIARQIKARLGHASRLPPFDGEKALAWVEGETGITLAKGQREAVLGALKEPVLVVTGGPGVGKTTVLDSVMRILRTKKVHCVLAAPTGRAARRLAEGTGEEASTLHRLLEFQGGVGFKRNRGNPLEGDLFVVDESSMIDVVLMGSLLDALPEEAHLLLVGDNDQLPSVGPGRVLGDLIDSGTVPVVRLTEIYRQAAESRIISSAYAVNEGRVPDLAPSEGGDFYWVEQEDPEASLRMMEKLIRDRFPARFGLDPVRDVQILTPMNKGPLGTQALNERFQRVLNPEREGGEEFEHSGRTIRRGDKVIQTRNNYDEDVFNGDIGFVVAIETDPLRVVVNFEGDRQVRYPSEGLNQLQLAYAITIHRSQGSEFPAVVVPVSTQHFVMLRRNLLYTAITRGKNVVVLVGQKRAFGMAVRTGGERDRITGLSERLAGQS